MANKDAINSQLGLGIATISLNVWAYFISLLLASWTNVKDHEIKQQSEEIY